MRPKHWLAIVAIPFLMLANGLSFDGMILIVVVSLAMAAGLTLYDLRHLKKYYYESEIEDGADNLRGGNS